MNENKQLVYLEEMDTWSLGECHSGEIRMGYHNQEWHVFVGGKHWASGTDKEWLENRSDPNVLNDDIENEENERLNQEQMLLEMEGYEPHLFSQRDPRDYD